MKSNKRGQVENERVYFKPQWGRCKGYNDIRLHMWRVQMNCKMEIESLMCSLCERKEDTTEHGIECGREK